MIGLARILWLLQHQPEAVMGFETAAVLYGLPVIGQHREIHIITSPGASGTTTVLPRHDVPGRIEVVARRHRLPIDDSEITTVHGIRVVTLQRLMLDMARLRPAGESLVVTDAALRTLTGATRFRQEEAQLRAAPIIANLLERLGQMKGATGLPRAREVLRFTNPLSESFGESRMKWIALALGLPEPVAQKLVTVDGQDYYLDLWIKELKAGFEFDGLLKYDTTTSQGRDAFIREKRRDDHLMSAGLLLHHFMGEDVATLDAGRVAFTRALGQDALQRLTPRRHLLG